MTLTVFLTWPFCEPYRFVNLTILWTLLFCELLYFTILWTLPFCEIYHFVNFTVLWTLLFCQLCELHHFVNLFFLVAQDIYINLIRGSANLYQIFWFFGSLQNGKFCKTVKFTKWWSSQSWQKGNVHNTVKFTKW